MQRTMHSDSWLSSTRKDSGLQGRVPSCLPARWIHTRCLRANYSCKAGEGPHFKKRWFRVSLEGWQSLGLRSGCSGMPIVKPKDWSEMLHIVDPNAAGTNQKCACECLSKYPVILQGKTRIRSLSQSKREFIFSKIPRPIPNSVRNPNECEYSFQISACKQVWHRSSLFVRLCGSVQTQRGQIVGLRSGQIKPIHFQRKWKARKTSDK